MEQRKFGFSKNQTNFTTSRGVSTINVRLATRNSEKDWGNDVRMMLLEKSGIGRNPRPNRTVAAHWIRVKPERQQCSHWTEEELNKTINPWFFGGISQATVLTHTHNKGGRRWFPIRDIIVWSSLRVRSLCTYRLRDNVKPDVHPVLGG